MRKLTKAVYLVLLFGALLHAQDIQFGNVKITGYTDLTASTAPANPASGIQRWYANSGTGKMACLTSAGADCNPATAGAGDALAPVSSTDGNIPQWDGTDTKTLKNGLAVASANTASAVVQRDISGNFAAGMITANVTGAVTGNASTASALAADPANCSVGNFATGINAAGVADCSPPAGAGDVLGPATNTDSIYPLWDGANSKTLKNGTAGASANTVSTLVLRDGSGNFAAGTITAALTGNVTGTVSGNAGTATALAANGANCSAGQFPLSVDASGATETCTALPTTIAGTANQVTASAATGAVTLSLAAAQLVRTCEIVTGDPGQASIALANDNDTPGICSNKTGVTLTITAVECYAATGSPTVTPIVTGGAATSILTGALTCGTGSFAAGTLNGAPTQANNGTIDGNITTAGGTAKFIIIRITRTL